MLLKNIATAKNKFKLIKNVILVNFELKLKFQFNVVKLFFFSKFNFKYHFFSINKFVCRIFFEVGFVSFCDWKNNLLKYLRQPTCFPENEKNFYANFVVLLVNDALILIRNDMVIELFSENHRRKIFPLL